MTAQKGKDLLIKIADGAGYAQHNGEVTFDMALDSAGELTFAAEV